MSSARQGDPRDSWLAHHVMLRLDDNRVLAPTPAARRRAARVLYEQGEARDLLAFRVVDTHLHALLRCDQAEANRFANYAASALCWALDLGVSFARARVRVVRDQSHLMSAFRYLMRQERHHGVASDPLHDASSLPDLLGLRLLGGATCARVRAFLPRVTRAELWAFLGTPDLTSEIGAEPPPLPLTEVCDAAAAALAIPELRGRTPDVVRACAAAAQATDASPHEIARALGRSLRSAQRLRGYPIDAALRRALELQIRLRVYLREHPHDSAAPLDSYDRSGIWP